VTERPLTEDEERAAIRAGTLCYSHHRVELSEPGDFRACFECGHIWRTRDEFLADVEVGCREADVPMDPDQPFCPLCVHDF